MLSKGPNARAQRRRANEVSGGTLAEQREARASAGARGWASCDPVVDDPHLENYG